MKAEVFDLLVIGAGPAGLACAAKAAESGLRVALLEAARVEQQFRIGEHLAPSGKAHLRTLGLCWDSLSYASPGVAVSWEEQDLRYKDYFFHPLGGGLNLQRPDFDVSLLRIAGEAGVCVSQECKVYSVQRESFEHWRVACSEGEFLARFLVDAGGRNSRLPERPVEYLDRLVGVSAFLEGLKLEARHLHIEAMKSGWWYLAPVSESRLMVTWMSDGDLLREEGDSPRSAWQKHLESSRVIRELIGLPKPSEVSVTCARTRRSSPAVGDGWLAVGDAAYSLDPLSSQGIEKGLRQGLESVPVITAALEGEKQPLRELEKRYQNEFRAYLETRKSFYEQVNRWPHSEFWARRRGTKCESLR